MFLHNTERSIKRALNCSISCAAEALGIAAARQLAGGHLLTLVLVPYPAAILESFAARYTYLGRYLARYGSEIGSRWPGLHCSWQTSEMNGSRPPELEKGQIDRSSHGHPSSIGELPRHVVNGGRRGARPTSNCDYVTQSAAATCAIKSKMSTRLSYGFFFPQTFCSQPRCACHSDSS